MEFFLPNCQVHLQIKPAIVKVCLFVAYLLQSYWSCQESCFEQTATQVKCHYIHLYMYDWIGISYVATTVG